MPTQWMLTTAALIVGILLMSFFVRWYITKADKKKIRQPVRGTLTVAAASHPPDNASYATCRIQGVVSGPGIQPTSVAKAGMTSTKKWPTPGSVLPIEFEASDLTRFNILWDEVPTSAALGEQAAALLAQQMASGGQPLEARGVFDFTAGTPAGPSGVMVGGQLVSSSLVGAIPGANILTEGLTGTAEVMAVRQTGTPPGTLGEFDLTLVVTPDQPGLVPYQANLGVTFQTESARRKDFLCHVRAQFPVRFDAQAPQLVTIDPARMPAGSGF